ncbi:HEAT repeat-containing protein 1 isoform X1 [Python bivittatus]|uniref:HEAT repeat-containing protein 1 n=2 Tax=Python bivittatus TaxID=176946 RepID=A0A9F2WAU9_PYTBI|nr:HEAT repeat-containing protein 1 isoform X1 [Python bivittatus]XP_025026840.1 HEAT repeat-containing protein 1 isoform X1 [Python bivittatus]
MTSLAHQLKRLALPQNDPSLLSRREAASLLFDCKEAASIDRETFFAIGCTGLEELIGIDPSFEVFQTTLFSQMSKGFERSVQTKAVNQQLDENISLFLIHLSPYFMLKPAQKCLEWLIHRFHIHLYNQDSLIGCVLPYHETKLFVRVIQLLKISDPTHKWHWLHPIQKPGVPLARGTLITHCHKDLGFMDFLYSLVTKSVKVFSQYPGSSSQMRVLLTFYASTVVSALGAVASVTDTLVSKLLPYIQKGLKSSLVDYRAATYMIICQLTVRVTMEKSLVHSLMLLISKTLTKTPSLVKDGLGCLIVLLQSQKEEGLGEKPYVHLCNVPNLIATLHEISAIHDVSPFLHYLLPHLVHSVIYGKAETEEGSNMIENQIYIKHLEAILTTIPLEKDLDHLLACKLLEDYISYGVKSDSDLAKIAEINKELLPVIRLFERKYSRTLDLVLEEYLKNVKNQKEQELFHQFISLSVSGGKYQFLEDSNTSLLLSLNHPQPAVRVLAVQHLKEIIETSKEGFDDSFIQEAIVARLKDDNLEVVMSSLHTLDSVLVHLNTFDEQIVLSLLSLFERADLSKDEKWCKTLEMVLCLLMKVDTFKNNKDLFNQLVLQLLPFLVITNNDLESAEGRVAIRITESSLCSLHPLLKGWPEVFQEVINAAKSGDLPGVSNAKLLDLLSKNLISEDSSFMSEMVEGFISLIEKESPTGKQKLTGHIISFVLVQSCYSCSQMEECHLFLALRIFHVLSKKMDRFKDNCPLENFSAEFPSGSELFWDLLSTYIQKLNIQAAVDLEDAMLLIILLRSFIEGLVSPSSFLKDEVWWNPETLNANSKDYLHLLLGLFDIVVCGASEGLYAGHFRAMMRLLFEVHLKGPEHQFRFLSILWTYSYNLCNQLNFVVDAVLHTRALYIGCAMLESQPKQKKRQLVSTASPVIVSLLINLGSPVSEIRRASLKCLRSLSGIEESIFHPVLQSFMKKAEEITCDSTYVIQVLGDLFGGEPTQLKQKAKQQKLTEALTALLECVQALKCPSYIAKNLMKILHKVNGSAVLISLLPVLNQLLEKAFGTEQMLKDETLLLHLILGKYNEHSAALLCTNQECLHLFIKAFHASQEVYKGLHPFQIIALGQITKPFFAALPDRKIQQRILGVLFDLLLNCKNPHCAQTISSVFKGISVDAEQISIELEPLPKIKNVATVHQTRRQKMQQQRKVQDQECVQEESVNWQRITLILELLQHKKKLKQPQALIPTLFNLLSRCLEPTAGEENLEYTKQLILGGLLNICQKLSPNSKRIKAGLLDEEKFNVELIVQCIRVSEMPQIHHHALLLLGAAAGMFPDKVLHNIMPIFTFMGANVMRLDDMYSFQVINKTVQMVIPALIQAEEDGGSSGTAGNMEGVAIKIIRVFVDALPHVPEHRRLPILEQLISTLGVERFLWILLVLLFEQHVTKSVTAVASGEKDIVLETDTEFWITVCCEFSVIEQLQSLMKLLNYLTDLPENKEDDLGQKKSRLFMIQSYSQETELFDVESHSGKQLRHLKFLAVSFMSQLLASHNFVKKVIECEDSEELKEFEQKLLEKVLCYINAVAQSIEKNANTLTAKFWKALLNKSYELLDKINSLIPTETFITVLRGLMINQLPSVRRKAMDLLNNKLQQRTQWKQTEVELLLELVPDLLAVVQHQGREAEEQTINRQTALYSLKLLCKCFGTEKHELFVAVLKAAIEVISSDGKEERNIIGSALLCAAEVTCVLKALAIPQLPRLMPALLNILKHKKELVANEIYLLSTVTALLKIVETLPCFLSPYLLDVLLQVVHLDRIAVEMGPSSHVNLRVASLKTTLATKLPSRVLLPATAKCYGEIANAHKYDLGTIMDILKEHIVTLENSQLSAHQSELTAFFTKALDFRAEHSQDNLEKVGKIEARIITCLISMVMKLSEMSFRPLFFKLFDWAKTEDAPKDRQLTFYRLADCIAGELKGLFSLFAGHLVKPFADILNQINTSKTDADEAYFGSEDDTEKSCLLLQYSLDCLYKIFLFDSHHFVSKERAETLMLPLVNQLENMLGGEAKFQERVTAHLIPCLAQFAVAMADDSLWKPLNYQVLLKMRHASPKVRFAALLAVLELAEKIRENYMVLLPESIPFLAELMEDECEEVEHQCQKTIQQLEVILGEPLQSYF